MATQDNKAFGEVDKVLAQEVDNAFYRSRILDSVYVVMQIEFAKYDVSIDRDTGIPLAVAMKSALEKYKEAIIQETVNEMTNGLAKALE